MKIQKLGHCCLVAEPSEGIRVMTDPGSFSTSQNEVKNISAVLITHEHQDHLHIDSLKKVLENNPNAQVDILALPVAGPWMKIKECIDYAKLVKPRIAFPVHDAILLPQFSGFIPKMVGHFLSESGISMAEMELGKEENL